MGAWIAVAVGGALRSVARHGVNHLVHTPSAFLDIALQVSGGLLAVWAGYAIGIGRP
jgi:hypothetical protein